MGVPVVVEVVGLAPAGAGLRFRVQTAPLEGLDDPDGVARHLAGVADGAGPGVVLHSTSWRHTGEAVVVTYALFPDPLVRSDGTPMDHHLATGTGPLAPRPLGVDACQVAAHAVRHLADLADGRDPHVVACAQERPGEWALLRAQAALVHAHLPRGRGPASLRSEPG